MKNKKIDGKLLSPEQVAARLGVSVLRVHEMVKQKLFPSGIEVLTTTKAARKRVRFNPETLDKWIATGPGMDLKRDAAVPHLLSAEEAARRLNVNVLRLYDMVKQGILTRGIVVRIGSHRMRFDSTALERWITTGGMPEQEEATNNAEVQKAKRPARRRSVQAAAA